MRFITTVLLIMLIVDSFLEIKAQNRRATLEEASGLSIGDQLSDDLSVYDTEGKMVAINSLLKGQYTVIVNGCLTCPVFFRTYPKIEAVHRDYSSKGVNFYYLYKNLAHPENNGYIKPYTIEERLSHVEEAKRLLQTKVSWLTDPMTDEVTQAFGGLSNSEFLFDPDGKVAYMKDWSDGNELRKKLENLVGKVSKVTSVESLGLPDVIGKSTKYEGIVSKIEVDEIMFPVIIEPEPVATKYYVKLRAEVNESLLVQGKGQIYLGFHLDPIHHVHWNNLADPVRYEIEENENIQVNPARGLGPKVEQPSDIDPREFLVNVENWAIDEPLELSLKYFACDENDKWCIPASQRYKIYRKFDHTGGRVYDRSFWEYHKSKAIELPKNKN